MWISQKQKVQIKARRKKKLLGSGHSGDERNDKVVVVSSSTKSDGEKINIVDTGIRKRTRTGDLYDENIEINKEVSISIPEGLSGKELKKFRKDARRKARVEGRGVTFLDANGIGLATEENVKSDADNIRPVKKRKTTFPRINDLLAQAEADKKALVEVEKRRAVDNAVPAQEKSKYVALDCEMVGIGAKGIQSALARVSLVDWDGSVLLDTFVQVPDRVTDFRTWVSGVRPKDILSKAMELHTCRKQVGTMLQGKILVGHSLSNDLAALMLDHPKHEMRDTARYKPFMKQHGSKYRPRKLKVLVKEHVGITIQAEGEAHNSVDDARATMELFKVARAAWEKDLQRRHTGKKL